MSEPAEDPIYIDQFWQGSHHYFDESNTDFFERRPYSDREVWIDRDQIPPTPPAQSAYPGTPDGSGTVSGISGIILTNPSADGQTFVAEVPPNPLGTVFQNVVPSNYNGGAYAPTLTDANGQVVPFNPAVWVADGVQDAVFFKEGVPEGFIPPFTIDYWEYTGTFAGAGGGTITGGTNVGAGTGQVFRDTTIPNLNFRTLEELSGPVKIATNGDVVEFDSSLAVTTAANVGAGSGVFRDATTAATGTTLNLRSITGGGNISVIEGVDEILIEDGAGTIVDDLELYVSTGGNDVTGDGSVGNPFLTIDRALEEVNKVGWNDTAEIRILDATYPLPPILNLATGARGEQKQPLIIRGWAGVNGETLIASEALTAVSTNQFSKLVTVDIGNPNFDSGRRARFATGALATYSPTIPGFNFSNNTAPVEVFCAGTGTSAELCYGDTAPAIGDTIDIIENATTVTYTGDITWITDGSTVVFENLNINPTNSGGVTRLNIQGESTVRFRGVLFLPSTAADIEIANFAGTTISGGLIAIDEDAANPGIVPNTKSLGYVGIAGGAFNMVTNISSALRGASELSNALAFGVGSGTFGASNYLGQSITAFALTPLLSSNGSNNLIVDRVQAIATVSLATSSPTSQPAPSVAFSNLKLDVSTPVAMFLSGDVNVTFEGDILIETNAVGSVGLSAKNGSKVTVLNTTTFFVEGRDACYDLENAEMNFFTADAGTFSGFTFTPTIIRAVNSDININNDNGVASLNFDTAGAACIDLTTSRLRINGTTQTLTTRNAARGIDATSSQIETTGLNCQFGVSGAGHSNVGIILATASKAYLGTITCTDNSGHIALFFNSELICGVINSVFGTTNPTLNNINVNTNSALTANSYNGDDAPPSVLSVATNSKASFLGSFTQTNVAAGQITGAVMFVFGSSDLYIAGAFNAGTQYNGNAINITRESTAEFGNNVTASNSATGSGIVVDDASSVSIQGNLVCEDNALIGVTAQDNSVVKVVGSISASRNQNGVVGVNSSQISAATITCEQCVVDGVRVSAGSTINSSNITVRQCGAGGVLAQTGAKIVCGSIVAEESTEQGVVADDGSQIIVSGGITANGNGVGGAIPNAGAIYVTDGSTLTVAGAVTSTTAANGPVFLYLDASQANLGSLTTGDNTVFGEAIAIYTLSGSTLKCGDVDLRDSTGSQNIFLQQTDASLGNLVFVDSSSGSNLAALGSRIDALSYTSTSPVSSVSLAEVILFQSDLTLGSSLLPAGTGAFSAAPTSTNLISLDIASNMSVATLTATGGSTVDAILLQRGSSFDASGTVDLGTFFTGTGITVRSSTFAAGTSVDASGGGTGISVENGGRISAQTLTANSNTARGLLVDNGSSATISGTTTCDLNGTIGIEISDGSHVSLGIIICNGNGGGGAIPNAGAIYVTDGSTLNASGAVSSTTAANGPVFLYLDASQANLESLSAGVNTVFGEAYAIYAVNGASTKCGDVSIADTTTTGIFAEQSSLILGNITVVDTSGTYSIRIFGSDLTGLSYTSTAPNSSASAIDVSVTQSKFILTINETFTTGNFTSSVSSVAVLQVGSNSTASMNNFTINGGTQSNSLIIQGVSKMYALEVNVGSSYTSNGTLIIAGSVLEIDGGALTCSSATGGTGVRLTEGSRLKVSILTAALNTVNGLSAVDASTVIVSGPLTLDNNARGAIIDNGSTLTANSLNSSLNTSEGIVIRGASTCVIDGLTTCDQNGTNGIEADDDSHLTLNNVSCSSNGGDGINLRNSKMAIVGPATLSLDANTGDGIDMVSSELVMDVSSLSIDGNNLGVVMVDSDLTKTIGGANFNVINSLSRGLDANRSRIRLAGNSTFDSNAGDQIALNDSSLIIEGTLTTTNTTAPNSVQMFRSVLRAAQYTNNGAGSATAIDVSVTEGSLFEVIDFSGTKDPPRYVVLSASRLTCGGTFTISGTPTSIAVQVLNQSGFVIDSCNLGAPTGIGMEAQASFVRVNDFTMTGGTTGAIVDDTIFQAFGDTTMSGLTTGCFQVLNNGHLFLGKKDFPNGSFTVTGSRLPLQVINNGQVSLERCITSFSAFLAGSNGILCQGGTVDLRLGTTLSISGATSVGILLEAGSALRASIATFDVSLSAADGIRLRDGSQLVEDGGGITSAGGANAGFGLSIETNSNVAVDVASTVTGAAGDVRLGTRGPITWALIGLGAVGDRNDFALAGTANVSIVPT